MNKVDVSLISGPGFADDKSIKDILVKLKSSCKTFVIVDYTHPTAILNNIKAYVEADCDFVMVPVSTFLYLNISIIIFH